MLGLHMTSQVGGHLGLKVASLATVNLEAI